MTLPAPSVVAIRAVQQYRRRDVVPYLALRYYLDSRSARRPRWASDVAVALSVQETRPIFFASKHFKDRDADGTVGHRELYLPGANEALAEAVLLGECARHAVFCNSSCVFSYDLARGDEIDGVFRRYYHGLRRRQRAIAAGCRSFTAPVVRYFDIQTFYPSICQQVAENAWTQACAEAGLSARMTQLGNAMLARQFAFRPRGRAELLTGPMFSHLIASLVLRDLDNVLSTNANVRYFRYVDDIVLVGPPPSVDAARSDLDARLHSIGVRLHPPGSGKHLVVDGSKWLEGEHDFEESEDPVQWRSLVGAMKWLLLGAPGRLTEIRGALWAEGFRLPLADYSGCIREAGYVARLGLLTGLEWFVRRRRRLHELVSLARELRDRYLRETEGLLSRILCADEYERKRLLPKLRYRAGRLAYLADRQHLANLAEELGTVPEVHFHATVLASIATGDVTQSVRLGVNAAQAVAQPLRAENRKATFQGPPKNEVELRGLGVLALNGVAVSGVGLDEVNDEFLRLARGGATGDIMRSKDLFIREFASLHGVGKVPRHSSIVTSAFHSAEEATFDAVGQAVFSDSDW